MKSYKVKINTNALLDIKEATDWYNKQLPKLGTRFQNSVKQHINTLKYNADGHSLRYGDVRCTLVKKFPFLIHYVIDDANHFVEVFAIIHTSRNPKIWEQKTNRG